MQLLTALYYTTRFGIGLLAFFSLLLGGCGGGETSPTNAPQYISVTPVNTSISAGLTIQFTATVEGNSTTAVTWSVQEGASGGSITSDGLYTAPSMSGAFHVVATSQTDSTKSATATVRVTVAPPPPIIGIFPDATFISLPPSTRDPFDGTKIMLKKTIILPSNCPQTFAIANVGPQGSTMDYLIVAENFSNGFVYQNDLGSLSAGNAATVTFSVHPDFVINTATGGPSSLIGSTELLSIFTPQASNYIKSSISVDIRSTNDALLGTWSGTWSGNSYGRHNPGQPEPSAPVSGTWILNMQNVDLANKTASGTLTWNGTDAFWTYTTDGSGNFTSATPRPFIPNRTIQFDNSNTTFDTAGPCRFHLTVEGFANASNPSDAFYGPWFNIDVDIASGLMTTAGGWTAHPYNIDNFDTALSTGSVSGSKSQ